MTTGNSVLIHRPVEYDDEVPTGFALVSSDPSYGVQVNALEMTTECPSLSMTVAVIVCVPLADRVLMSGETV